ncbi:hypothetical protein [Paracoccus sp. (in: a-proteobacteria)]|uniref:hypothetical protein n=1 Tax=Paracoccus sp. TaxID=267 RepID=UPI0028A7B473|nr:hypothetical protein [Paracoccus sp. (in: a-proteobacteria)]
MTDDAKLIERLDTLHKSATAGNLDTAEIKQIGSFECPLCDGNGEVEGEQFINYDGVAVNVLFSGIGEEFQDNSAWYSAISREWPQVSARLTALTEENERLREAAIALRDDMLERAECKMDVISGKQYRVVNAGNTAWANFCAALSGDEGGGE